MWGGVPWRDGLRCGGETLGGVGRIEQTKTAGGGNVGLTEVRVAEVDPPLTSGAKEDK